MHLLNQVSLFFIKCLFVEYILEMLHIHFVLVSYLVVHKSVFLFNLFYYRWILIVFEALLGVIADMPPVKEFVAALFLS